MTQTNSVPRHGLDAEPEIGSVVSTREIPSWVASLGVHVLVLAALSTFKYATAPTQVEDVITSIVEDVEEVDYRFDVTLTDQVGNMSNANQLSSSQAVAQLVSTDMQREVQRRIEEEVLVVESVPVAEIPQVAEAQLSSVINTTGVAEKTGGIEGSLDRITFEIMNSLRERPTLVVWLFDESPSMKLRRDQITQRFQSIYGQLAALDPEHNQHLKTAVVGFGKGLNFYTPEPTNDVAEAVKLVNGIKDDDSGIEMIFTAIGRSVEKFRKYRLGANRHNAMIIAVTDERGDDLEQLEKTSATCSNAGFKVFCIGHASPFGRQKGYVRWQWSDGFQDDVEIDQGPESVRMESVDMPFWGAQGVDLSRLSSGLGPYHLTRICAESGGLYLITDEHRHHSFDFAVMRSYLPDYRPENVYLAELKKSPTKRALVETAERIKDFQQSNRRVNVPPLQFRADNDNTLRTEATNAQRQVVEFEFYVNEIVKALELGEKDRAKLKEPRWRAAYDLAYGRSLALLARAQGYNIMMAQMKVAPKTFSKAGNNTWIMKPSKDTQAGPTIKKLIQKATEYLSRVVDEHQNTPWAELAARELHDPMGWEWAEERRDYEEMARQAAEAQRKQVLFADENDPKKPGTKKQQPMQREKPRL